MSKKRISNIIMLAVLVIGIACVVYGVTGTAIYCISPVLYFTE